MMVAAHAVSPICPRCCGPVRRSVEIQAALADLEETVVDANFLRTSPLLDDRDRYEVIALHVCQELHALQAELAGEHLSCARSRVDGTR